MSSPGVLLDRYKEVCKTEGIPVHKYILKVLGKAQDDYISEPSDEMTLDLAGNNKLLTDVRLEDRDMVPLCQTLANSTFVSRLDLRYNNITDEGAKHLGKLIETSVSLRFLNVMCNDIGPEGAEHIARGLHTNETLSELKVNGNKIGNKGGMFFASALQINTGIEQLDLGDADLGTESVIALATILHYNKFLKALNVNRPLLFTHQASTNSLYTTLEETTVHMANMLKVNTTLREIHLQKYDMRDFGAERLVETLQENIALTYLDLSCNRITRDGAKHLSKLLKKNTPLQVLDLGFNRIEDDGAIYLSEALKHFNTNLHTLVIAHNCIRGTGLVAVADAMKTNTSLYSVFIWGNELEESACVPGYFARRGVYRPSSPRARLPRSSNLDRRAKGSCRPKNEFGIQEPASLKPPREATSPDQYHLCMEQQKCPGIFAAFNDLIESGRLDTEQTDVQPYVVDGRVYLSELSHGIRRHYYWTPSYGPDVEKKKDDLLMRHYYWTPSYGPDVEKKKDDLLM
ncbi:Leucine-rich repeat-containing protein 34 [Branchiostoma belcheri]|nr:Leucine-rich repeat-containing protein 34 [Branchiostoma belcheri]